MSKLAELLTILHEAEVEFVIIGGVAAAAYGSATLTQDVDVAAPFTVKNLKRLMDALAPFHPKFALTPDKRPIDRSPEELANFKNLYLLTDLGRLDLLSEVPPIGDFQGVAERADRMELFGFSYLVVSLDDLIAIKEALGRAKDQIVLIELRAIRERLGGKSAVP